MGIERLAIPVLVILCLLGTGPLCRTLGARAVAHEERIAEAARQAPALHVMHCTGTNHLDGRRETLVPGDVVRIDEVLHVEGAVRLNTPEGDRLKLTGPATLAITARAPHRLECRQHGGQLEFTAAAAGTIVLHTPHRTVICQGGAFRADCTSDPAHITTLVPPVHIDETSAPTTAPVDPPLPR